MNGKTMKAAVVPPMGGDWRVRDVAIPQPALDQVLIGVRASGLSSRTLSRRSRAGAGGLPSGGLRAAYRPRVRRRDRAKAADRLGNVEVDVLEELLPGYVRPNFCEIIAGSPFRD